MESLFEQLDLAVYSLPRVHWWYHPIVQLLLALVTIATLVGVIFIARVRKKNKPVSKIQQLLDSVYEQAGAWENGKITSAVLLQTVSQVIRQYTHVMTSDQGVLALTDEQWLAYVKTHAVFQAVIQECRELSEMVAYYKFCGKSLDDDQGRFLIGLVYDIIAKTSSGAISLASDFAKNRSKSGTT
jgi:hypothetical protein